jgi:hypothetical protein
MRCPLTPTKIGRSESVNAADTGGSRGCEIVDDVEEMGEGLSSEVDRVSVNESMAIPIVRELSTPLLKVMRQVKNQKEGALV